MPKHSKLTKEERIEIASLLKADKNQSQIALQIGKSKTTISREINRNKDPVSGNYNYSIAHKQARERKSNSNKLRSKITLGSELEKYILKKLEIDWSPEQISGRLKTELKSSKNSKVKSLGLNSTISYQTIYNYIYLTRPHWKKYLRIISSKGRYRRKYGTKVREKFREESKKKRIDVRPEIINTRDRLGDFEGDTIVGGEKNIHILTHVDRKSGYLVADKAESITKESIAQLTIQSLKKLPKTKVKSITYDNGVQFEKHQDTEQKLRKITNNNNFNIYFAYPYHSWERGTNENTNGLIRKYYPKKTPFKNIAQKELDKVVKLINNRPRKRLNYLTPTEVFRGRGLVAIRD
jgi:IS30 family transposase